MSAMVEHSDPGDENDSRLTEEERVDLWREGAFERMGFTEEEVTLLLMSDVSRGDAERLLLLGCPTHLAVRILS
jgi:hypothetical protein